VRVTVVAGVADALPADDNEFAPGSRRSCSAPSRTRPPPSTSCGGSSGPGGELRFYEHVLARDRTAAEVQRGLDGFGIWPRVGAGCQVSRDTLTAIEDAGFVVERCRRFPFGPGPFQIPHVLGTARLPA
jgi:hypothetical protein